ncbi:MAG: bifunctional phosphopantothenoylcysteine decarboxylase/phosphopantothenate--cysteine ligase CoaBC [Muribaculaceae bacterium]|nr:bifunctional phosphopantothenoylcysteine decarboxylase/phosphopantothenate--cysteine ligase CoaBC [Muribaculaceae bacterium]
MMSPLSGKHIVLGICGGIAAYKSVSLLRLLVKAGAEVQVVITPAGKQFITPVTLSALSQKPVVSEFFTANTGEWHSHVDLGLWADCMVIAPATASTIGKMAHGVADNMLVTTYLSAKSPVFIAPAMDLDMMAHPSTQSNLALLRSYGNHIIEPESGFLASGLVGKGRMEEPENILNVLEDFFQASGSLDGKKVLITAGPTYERIDPVRFIGNFSSGKMGFALARACADRGAEVTLVTGPVSLTIGHPAIKRVDVESGRQMLQACQEAFPTADIAIMCAAVADYTIADPATSKIKREDSEIPELKLVKNPDIAATLGASKRPGQRLIGFALETDHELDNARRKLDRKNLDMIVLNSMRTPGAGFGTDTNAVTVIPRHGDVVEIPLKSKAEIAADIVGIIASSLPES